MKKVSRVRVAGQRCWVNCRSQIAKLDIRSLHTKCRIVFIAKLTFIKKKYAVIIECYMSEEYVDSFTHNIFFSFLNVRNFSDCKFTNLRKRTELRNPRKMLRCYVILTIFKDWTVKVSDLSAGNEFSTLRFSVIFRRARNIRYVTFVTLCNIRTQFAICNLILGSFNAFTSHEAWLLM